MGDGAPGGVVGGSCVANSPVPELTIVPYGPSMVPDIDTKPPPLVTIHVKLVPKRDLRAKPRTGLPSKCMGGLDTGRHPPGAPPAEAGQPKGFHSMQEFISTAGDLAGLLALISSIPNTVLALRRLTAPRHRDNHDN